MWSVEGLLRRGRRKGRTGIVITTDSVLPKPTAYNHAYILTDSIHDSSGRSLIHVVSTLYLYCIIPLLLSIFRRHSLETSVIRHPLYRLMFSDMVEKPVLQPVGSFSFNKVPEPFPKTTMFVRFFAVASLAALVSPCLAVDIGQCTALASTGTSIQCCQASIVSTIFFNVYLSLDDGRVDCQLHSRSHAWIRCEHRRPWHQLRYQYCPRKRHMRPETPVLRQLNCEFEVMLSDPPVPHSKFQGTVLAAGCTVIDS